MMIRINSLFLLTLILLILSCKPAERSNPLDPAVNETRGLLVPSIYSTIQEAIDNSEDGDTVLVNTDTLRGDGNKNISFKGKKITVKSLYGPDSTIIDLEQDGRAFLFQNGEDSLSILEGFTILNGFATLGGSIYCVSNSSPHIKNCNFTNSVSNEGGAIYVNSGSPTISNCIFKNCSAESGGGIKLSNSYTKLSNSLVENCSAYATQDDHGSGIYITTLSDISIDSCTIQLNDGGSSGIYIDGLSNINLSASNLMGQSNSGIYFSQSSGIIENCTISGNMFGIQSYESNVNITRTNCSYNSNRNLIISGALSTINIDNSLFATNDANANLNITVEGPKLNIYQSTVYGGSFYVLSHLDTINIINSIIWSDIEFVQNTSNTDQVTITYSNVSGGYQGEGNHGGNPYFISDSDFHLSDSSLCLGVGTTEISTDYNIDLDGIVRAQPVGSNPDLGCYESDISSSPPTSLLKVPTINYPTIQSAINAASNGDTVLVDAGIYQENIAINEKNITLASHYIINNDTSYISSTIIDGMAEGSVLRLLSNPPGCAISGLTLINGYAKSNTQWNGGGIYIYNSINVTLNNLKIKENIASGGGGIYIDYYGDSENHILEQITLSNNSSSKGGGIFIQGNKSELNNITVTQNTANNEAGGIYLEGDNHVLTDILVTANNTASEGGGVYIRGDYNIIINLTVTDNTMNTQSSGEGGGILIVGSRNTLNNITTMRNLSGRGGGIAFLNGAGNILQTAEISYNECSDSGCGIYISDSDSLIMTDIIITNNIEIGNDFGGVNGAGMYYRSSLYSTLQDATIMDNSGTKGSGIYISSQNTQLEISNSAIIGNDATQDGGGILLRSGSSLTMNHVTISKNTAVFNGGGIHLDSQPDNLEIKSSIIWDNQPNSIASSRIDYFENTIFDYSAFPAEDLDGITLSGQGNIYDNPIFCDPENDNFTISDNSPCIDAGLNETTMGAYDVGNCGTNTPGCTDSDACNYCVECNVADSSCLYPCENDGGCTDNYDIEKYDCNGNCIVESDCSGNCGGNATVDSCGICGGSGPGDCGCDFPADACDCDGNILNECGICGGLAGECCTDCTCTTDVCLWITGVNETDKTLIVYMINNQPVAGFQWHMTGIEVPELGGYDANNGMAVNAGFSISNSYDGTYIGFSMVSNLIPIGEGVLIIINYLDKLSQVCIEDIVFSSQGGNSLNLSENIYCHSNP